jgi:hypothetical protein
MLMLQLSRWRDKRRNSESYIGGQMRSESNDAGPSRRAFLVRFAGAAFAAPVIASFALDGVAQAGERGGPQNHHHHQGNPNGGYPKQGNPNGGYPKQGNPNGGYPKQGPPDHHHHRK